MFLSLYLFHFIWCNLLLFFFGAIYGDLKGLLTDKGVCFIHYISGKCYIFRIMLDTDFIIQICFCQFNGTRDSNKGFNVISKCQLRTSSSLLYNIFYSICNLFIFEICLENIYYDFVFDSCLNLNL